MDQQVEYEPESRLLHVAACSESSDGKVIVWGGQTSASYYSSDGRTKLVSIVQEFDPRTEVWCQRDTVGTPHPGLSVAACTSVGNDLFLYGGEVPGYVCGALSRLDVKTLTWSLLSPEAVPGGPMRKTDCGIVLFHRDKLAVIGGYGYPTGHSTQLGSKFIRKGGTDEVLGWTNEFHVFNISQGLWSSPMLKGTELPPCIAFTLTSINKHRAILFGGFQPGRRGRVNDLYIIDFDTVV